MAPSKNGWLVLLALGALPGIVYGSSYAPSRSFSFSYQNEKKCPGREDRRALSESEGSDPVGAEPNEPCDLGCDCEVPCVVEGYNVLGEPGETCTSACAKKEMVCNGADDARAIGESNIEEAFECLGLPCNGVAYNEDLTYVEPSQDASRICRYQDIFFTFTCLGARTGTRRICPCV